MSPGLFHHHTEVVSRASEKHPAGRSVVASAAYRSGKPLFDQRHGRSWSYHKPEVMHEELMLPSGAPAWAADRERLWNAVEASEKRRDAQLAREVEFAIPLEVPRHLWTAWCREHLRPYVDRGMACDFSIHDKPDNPHCHALLTMREFDGANLAAKKNRSWNDRGLVDFHRERYETQCNTWLKANGSQSYVSRKSYVEQGIDQVPQIHVGAVALAIQEKGEEPSWRFKKNEAIKAHNAQRQALQKSIAGIQEAIHAALNAPPFRQSRRPPISGPLSSPRTKLDAHASARAAAPGLHPRGKGRQPAIRPAFSAGDPAGEALRLHKRGLSRHLGADAPTRVGGLMEDRGGRGDGLVPVREAALHAPGAAGALLPTGQASQRNHGPARGIARTTPAPKPHVVRGSDQRSPRGRADVVGEAPQRAVGAAVAAALALESARLAERDARLGWKAKADPGADSGSHGPTSGGGSAADQARRDTLERERRGPSHQSGVGPTGGPVGGGSTELHGDGVVGMDSPDYGPRLDLDEAALDILFAPERIQVPKPQKNTYKNHPPQLKHPELPVTAPAPVPRYKKK